MAVNLSDKSCASQPTQDILESPSTSSVISSQFVATPPNPPNVDITADERNEPWRTNNGRGRRRNNQRDRYRNLPVNHELFGRNPAPTYLRHFVIGSVSGENLAETDTIAANKQLETVLGGRPKKVNELRNGQLSVEVGSKTQSEAIVQLRALNDIPVCVTPNDRLNQTKGTIRYYNKPGHSYEKMLSEMKDCKAIDIYQMKRKINGILEPLPTYIITFATNQLPEEIKIGWTVCSVQLYIPRPRRCFKCQRFGHGKANCRSTSDICHICSEDKHDGQCEEPAKCANCLGNHPASSKDCYHYQFEEEVLATQAKEHLSYSDARKKVNIRFPQNNTTTIARVVGRGPAPIRRPPLPPSQGERRQLNDNPSMTLQPAQPMTSHTSTEERMQGMQNVSQSNGPQSSHERAEIAAKQRSSLDRRSERFDETQIRQEANKSQLTDNKKHNLPKPQRTQSQGKREQTADRLSQTQPSSANNPGREPQPKRYRKQSESPPQRKRNTNEPNAQKMNIQNEQKMQGKKNEKVKNKTVNNTKKTTEMSTVDDNVGNFRIKYPMPPSVPTFLPPIEATKTALQSAMGESTKTTTNIQVVTANFHRRASNELTESEIEDIAENY